MHLPTSVGGNAWGLACGERALGLTSEVLVETDNWLKYPADKILFTRRPRNIFEKMQYLAKIIREIFHIRNNYDVFHFNFGTSLLDLPRFNLPLLDLPLYKGKIVVTYNGCDARQKYPTMARTAFSACHNPACYAGMCNSGQHDKSVRERIAKFDKYADHIFAVNPDLLYFLPARARLLPYAITNFHDIVTQPWVEHGQPLKIVHAPTNRAAKGSDQIIAALEKAKQKYGDAIELQLVENIPHSEALRLYTSADIIIDQILIGWYGGFAVEAMKMGKPVMAFVRREDLHFLPGNMGADCLEAIINTNPDTIFDDLCKLIENRNLLRLHREAALEYVNKWHDPVYVAGLTKQAYES